MSINLMEFNDDVDVEMDWISGYSEKKDYEWLVKQREADPHHPWGDHLSVLIMSDRCPGRANGLREYLKAKTNLAHGAICKTLDEAKKHIAENPVDILIFVGYQKDKTNYEIKKLLKEKNPNTYAVKYASLDRIIHTYCLIYQIHYAFSTRKPVAEFIGYLKESYAEHHLLLSENGY